MSTRTLPVFLLLLAVCYGGKDKPVFSEEIWEVIQDVHQTCVEKTGAIEEDLKNCELGIFKEDPKLKCYMFCLVDEGALVDNNVIDWDMMIAFFPEQYYERVHKAIYTCTHLDVGTVDNCQKMFDINKCWYKSDPDFYLLF